MRDEDIPAGTVIGPDDAPQMWDGTRWIDAKAWDAEVAARKDTFVQVDRDISDGRTQGILTLHDDRWVSLRKIVLPELGIHGYTYSHESRCDGRIVSVLPYRYADDDRGAFTGSRLEVLLRDEVTPCWSVIDPQVSTITGGWEPLDDLACMDTAVRELWEEAGYRVSVGDLLDLGQCRGTKSTDTRYFLWGVDLTGKERTGDGSGDGSELEAQASCRWVTPDVLVDEAVDPLAHVAWNRLRAKIA